VGSGRTTPDGTRCCFLGKHGNTAEDGRCFGGWEEVKKALKKDPPQDRPTKGNDDTNLCFQEPHNRSLLGSPVGSGCLGWNPTCPSSTVWFKGSVVAGADFDGSVRPKKQRKRQTRQTLDGVRFLTRSQKRTKKRTNEEEKKGSEGWETSPKMGKNLISESGSGDGCGSKR